MKVNVWNTIMQLSKERSVEPRLIIQAIEESLRVASSQFFSQKENVQILFKPEKGELRVFVVKQVTDSPGNTALEISLDEARAIRPDAQEGETVEVDLPSDTLGRIAAQAAKKVIFQKVRDAEQDKIYGDFAPRIGEIVTGVVRRIEDSVIILEVNRIEVSFPLRETLPNEEHRRGDLVKAVIIQVLKVYQGPQIIVSRANPRFLARLLETEIPEIANGAIEIKDIVRQPGERSKVAVSSRERDVDPIGACIGVKGNRILAISKELQGE
ncbi:MAG TPA: transcription termination factor NusA, partial [Candidatus Latescibacteria bacterium]|nr:transcription termination factor NusA [Candidatus Latescibacterota bacterium]